MSLLYLLYKWSKTIMLKNHTPSSIAKVNAPQITPKYFFETSTTNIGMITQNPPMPDPLRNHTMLNRMTECEGINIIIAVANKISTLKIVVSKCFSMLSEIVYVMPTRLRVMKSPKINQIIV